MAIQCIYDFISKTQYRKRLFYLSSIFLFNQFNGLLFCWPIRFHLYTIFAAFIQDLIYVKRIPKSVCILEWKLLITNINFFCIKRKQGMFLMRVMMIKNKREYVINYSKNWNSWSDFLSFRIFERNPIKLLARKEMMRTTFEKYMNSDKIIVLYSICCIHFEYA